ncbi:lanthionine synthetase LanC family protein [uncultured Chitinophaga sp.]|uniref:protein kinase domain-containing protein n=1 Tax=uncultured Chitinophaga sp. TaxID=339340 RepID=UPI0025DECB89|nr:lanthionine synthetase LanC family protein [uncultured Chitinophaga sp.]
MKEETVVAQEQSVAVEDAPLKKSEKKAGRRIGYNYIIVKSLKESQKNDVVKCFYIKGLTKFGFCVIKEGTYGDSKDREGRDIKDRLLWQEKLHKELQGKVRIPKLLGSFEENGNYYLVIEYLRGKPLSKICKGQTDMWNELAAGTKKARRILKYILQVIELLQTMHANKVVHRDVTVNNFLLMPFGKVAIIDMELSYSLSSNHPSPPFTLGTQGYMSPEQLATENPTVKEDIYAVGAVILHLLTGISPYKITGVLDENVKRRVKYLLGDVALADVISRCFERERLMRPSLSEIRSVVQGCLGDKRVPQPESYVYPRQEITEMVQKGIEALGSPLFCDQDKGWFAENMKLDRASKTKFRKSWYASYNRGVAGILYFLSRAKTMDYDITSATNGVEIALNLIEAKYINRSKRPEPGLHFGADGIAACLCESIKAGIIPYEDRHVKWISQLLGIETTILGVAYGMAGQGIANVYCLNLQGEKEIAPRLKLYVTKLLATQAPDGSWNMATGSRKNRVIRGFGSGMSGILYFLLHYSVMYKDKEVEKGALKGVDWLVAHAKRGKTIHWLSQTGKELGVAWNEGVAGVALCMLKAYTVTGNHFYADVARGALRYPSNHIFYNSFSQADGLAGLGEVYLEAFSILRENEWRERAAGIAQTLMHLRMEKEDGTPYWLVEHESEPVANIMVGNTGILHFLMRYAGDGKIPGPMYL